jgi:hypothetical protein
VRMEDEGRMQCEPPGREQALSRSQGVAEVILPCYCNVVLYDSSIPPMWRVRCWHALGKNASIQYNTRQYDTTQYKTILYNTMRYDTILYDTTRYNTIQHNTIQRHTIQYDTIRYNTARYVQYNSIRYNTILSCKLHYTA